MVKPSLPWTSMVGVPQFGIPGLLRFLGNAPEASLHFIIGTYHGKEGVFQVVEWDESDDSSWALFVDGEPLGCPGEEVYLPIPWAEERPPSLREAIAVYRSLEW